MKRKKILLCIVIHFAFFPIMLFGQTIISRFTPDSVKFHNEISKFLEEARKKEAKEFMEAFTPIWYGGVISDPERRAVYRTCNFMLEKKMQPFPDFQSYLFSVVSFINSQQPKESFEAWQESIEKLIDSKNKKKFTEYLEFCNGLFSQNAIYISNSVVWKPGSINYQFEFDDKPYLVFPNTDLKCYAKGDSAIIYNTSGIYYPTLEMWQGRGGKVNWVRAGFQESEVFAELSNYNIKVKSASYSADSVVFQNSIYFDKPLTGKLTDKLLANVTEKNASYPRFESYDKRLRVTNMVDGVDFDGGFSQHGPKFIGAGSQEEDALLVFNRNGKPFLIAASKAFIIRADKIISDNAKITIYLENDSITHPGLKFNFLSKERKLSLFRSGEGVEQSPYFDSFHQVDIDVEEVRWKIDDPTMEFGTIVGATNKSASFSSADFYKQDFYDRLQGMDDIHPLIRVRDCVKKYGSDDAFTDDIARCMGFAPSQVRQMLMKLSTMGFIHYDFDNDKVILDEKIFHYIKAKAGKKDYDVIEFNSVVTEKNNATLNLLNFDFRLNGIKTIFLSDSHNVFIYPKNRQITLKKNRDFNFSGVIYAGKFEFFGKEFAFSYDNFKIDMPIVDSLRIKVETDEVDEYGQKILKRVKSVIEYSKGELLVDEMGNKSGIKPFPQYPIFNSVKDSYVFYEKEAIQKGVYKRDSFYFHLEPFSFDSIDNFQNPSLQFKGSFSSAGIFPTFEENLSLQPDFSLGFNRPTPAAGFPAYGGKGLYNNKIRLSHEGLRGDGILQYLTSTTESKDFIFFPDSMNTLARKYNIEEQVGGEVEYPPVNGDNVYVHWEPQKDVMSIKTNEKPMFMYAGDSRFFGTLVLEPKGLKGGGEFKFQGSEVAANLIRFKFSELDSDTAEFRLKSKSDVSDQLSFATNNVKAHIDFKERKGVFESNGGGSFIDFPKNQYIAFMDKFTWYMESEDIELTASTKEKAGAGQDVALEGSKFISAHPDQDSLSFYSKAARYDVKTSIIYARQVQFVPVADAYIYPDSGLVIVDLKAKIRTLENAEIAANVTTKFHKIYNASVNIFAKKKYSASGDYDYVDENKRKQVIKFTAIAADSSGQTYASGEILEDNNFTLSPNFEYKGDVRLTASNPFLKFSGTSRIQHNCDAIPRVWFKFSGEIDPEEIYIPIDSILVDEKNQKLSSSIMLRSDSVSMYSTFLSRELRYSDKKVLPANGFLYYDKGTREYRISNLAKLNQPSMPGNYISLMVDSCTVYAEGRADFGVNLGQINILPVGNITHRLADNDISLDLMLLTDFFMEENALENMAKNMETFQGLEGVTFDRKAYEMGLAEIIGKEEADKLISQVNLYGSFKKFPSEFNKPLFLTDVKMIWNPASRSYQSVGKIGVGNIMKRQINKYVEGYIEIEKKRSGDILNIFLELDRKNWYFFSYQRNVMQLLSSDDEFNKIVKEVKSDKRKIKWDKDQDAYSFILSNPAKKKDFLKKFDRFD